MKEVYVGYLYVGRTLDNLEIHNEEELDKFVESAVIFQSSPDHGHTEPYWLCLRLE